MAAADQQSLFDTFRVSAFRLETLPSYLMAEEAERIEAFRRGLPRPERSPRTNPWLKLVQDAARAGKSWTRVRVIDDPPTEYQRYQLIGYQESEAAGDHVRVARRSAVPDLGADFWLFDNSVAQLQKYDADGRFLGAEITADPLVIAGCRARRDRALSAAVSLGEYMADLEAA
jgi:hypothetical protein